MLFTENITDVYNRGDAYKIQKYEAIRISRNL